MAYCGECGQPLNAEARFCAACGADAAGSASRGQEEPELTVRLFSRADPRAGELVGDFELVREIARGGMGVVYLARQRRLDRDAAIKLISPELARDAVFRERFRSEALLAGSLSHPHIVPVYDADEANGELYIAMRYVAGMDLGSLIAKEGPLEPARAARIVSQVGAALDAAHARGLVHRDVKPANILIESPGPGEIAYLTDFGLLKRLGEESGRTDGGQWMGTVHYAAPEQIAGGPVDERADSYALGGVLYKALTADVPFPRDTPTAAMWAQVHEPPPAPARTHAGVPPQFDAVIRRAMAKAPADRFSSAGELGDAALAAARGARAASADDPAATGKQQFGGGGGGAMLGPRDDDSSAFPSGRLTGIQPAPAERPRQILVEPEPAKRGRSRRSILIACLVACTLLGGAALAMALTGAFSGDSRGEQVKQAKDRSQALLDDSDDLTKEMAGLTHELRGDPSPAARKRIADRFEKLGGRAQDLRRRATETAAGPGGEDPAVAYANRLIKQIADNQTKLIAKLALIARNPHDPRLAGFIAELRRLVAENRRKVAEGRGALVGGELPRVPTRAPTAAGTPPPLPPVESLSESWKQLPDGPAGLDASALSAQMTAFDGNLMEPIAVFAPAGASASSACDGELETWALTGSGWTQLDTAVSPPDCPVGGIAFDGANEQTVLVLAPEGELTQTWTFDGVDWTEAEPADAPPNAGPLAYDGSQEQLVMAGLGSDPTWTWDGEDWSEAGAGSELDAAALAYSPEDEALVAVGPEAGDPSGDPRTLVFDGSSWDDGQTEGDPPPIGALATDAMQQNLLLLPPAGLEQGGDEFEQWRWTGTSWRRKVLSVAPQPMSSLVTSSDPDTGSIYVLGFPGGADEADATPETWVYESTTLKRCGGDTPIDGLAQGAAATGIVADGVDCADARGVAAALGTLGEDYEFDGFSCEVQSSLDEPAYKCTSGDKTIRFAAAE